MPAPDASELTRMTAAELAAAIAAGQVSALEVTDAHLGRIDAAEQELHAFLHVAADSARAAARAVDERRAAGGDARAAGRRAAGPQGRVHHHGHAYHLRLPHPRRAGGLRTTPP